MSKYQEALMKLVNHNYSTRSEKNKHIKTLQELVNKETPMKPIRKGVLNWWHCPCCDASLYFDNQPRCQICGQKLDWSDECE